MNLLGSHLIRALVSWSMNHYCRGKQFCSQLTYNFASHFASLFFHLSQLVHDESALVISIGAREIHSVQVLFGNRCHEALLRMIFQMVFTWLRTGLIPAVKPSKENIFSRTFDEALSNIQEWRIPYRPQ